MLCAKSGGDDVRRRSTSERLPSFRAPGGQATLCIKDIEMGRWVKVVVPNAIVTPSSVIVYPFSRIDEAFRVARSSSAHQRSSGISETRDVTSECSTDSIGFFTSVYKDNLCMPGASSTTSAIASRHRHERLQNRSM
jgi:hypothetical protein